LFPRRAAPRGAGTFFSLASNWVEFGDLFQTAPPSLQPRRTGFIGKPRTWRGFLFTDRAGATTYTRSL